MATVSLMYSKIIDRETIYKSLVLLLFVNAFYLGNGNGYRFVELIKYLYKHLGLQSNYILETSISKYNYKFRDNDVPTKLK